MPKTILPNGVVVPFDLTSMKSLVLVSRGRRYRAVEGKMVDCGPAEGHDSTIIIETAHLRRATAAANRRNAAMLRRILLDLEARGLGRFVGVEVPTDGACARKMTLKEFKAAFGDKPGATFHCPDHLKHELDE